MKRKNMEDSNTKMCDENKNNKREIVHRHGIAKNGCIKNTNTSNKLILKDKVFIERVSLLTELFEVKHFKNIYYLILAILLALLINSVAYDVIYRGEIRIGHGLIINNFKDLHIVSFGWICMSFVNLFIFSAFHVWAYVYQEMDKKSILRKVWNYFAIICILFYYFRALKFAVYFVNEYNISVIGSVIILTEQIRIMMKTHAFIRGNVPKVLNNKSNSNTSITLPNFFDYIDFLFVPTLVYKDKYPRTKEIRWKEAFVGLCEVFGVIVYCSFLMENYFMPVCDQFKQSKFTVLDIVWAIMRNTLPAGALMMLMFYLVLHAWMNVFAEFTRFADRQFYQDWWNATSYDVFYRKWNIVVHDWLYMYIFKDLYEIIIPGNKSISKIAVFLISSIFHEYILYNCMRMFFPVLFVLFFSFGVALAFVKGPDKSLFNVLFLYGFALGLSITLSGYVLEYCAMGNDCAAPSSETFSLRMPNIFSSDCLI